MNPEISILCNAFQHEKYIAQALDGFIMQKLNVPFEILVHDDASTDGTAEIIRRYAQTYPALVFPIFQTENQYSQGVLITPQIQLPRARGKYIAFCEGDDFWTDPEKLQLQYDFMEQHPEYSLCCHAYSMVDREGKLIEERRDLKADGVVPTERLIGNQLLVPHFATMLARRKCLERLGARFLGEPCNDMLIRLYCHAQGPVYYLDRNMSCYRRFTENSWSVRIGLQREKFLAQQKDRLTFLEKYDEYTQGKYTEAIRQELVRRRFEIALSEGDYKAAFKSPAYRNASAKRRLGIAVGCVFPKLIDRTRKG